MKAIHVKPLQPTEKLPLRYKAVGLSMCAVLPVDYSLEPSGNAALVAQQLIDDYNSRHRTARLRIAGVGELPDNTYAVLLEKQVK